MSTAVDDITINYEENGIKMVDEIKKEIVTKGGMWITIMFLYKEFDRKKEAPGPLKATLRRYKKVGESYKQQSKFNISNAKQASKITSILNSWFEAEEA